MVFYCNEWLCSFQRRFVGGVSIRLWRAGQQRKRRLRFGIIFIDYTPPKRTLKNTASCDKETIASNGAILAK